MGRSSRFDTSMTDLGIPSPSSETLPVNQKAFKYTFTVFTPTYNRAHTLHRVYESLRAQTFRNFEWLVVDDGSTDHTRKVIRAWQTSASFPIRYVHQPNGGKHRAHNTALPLAEGELFLPLDSDDRCTDNALARLIEHWRAIPEAEREAFSGIVVLCSDRAGRIVGRQFPAHVVDCQSFDTIRELLGRHERWGFHRTSVLRKYPFPEFENENYLTEGVVWGRIYAAYRMRFLNEALRKYQRPPDGIDGRSVSLRIANPTGAISYYRQEMELHGRLRPQLRAAINMIRFSLHAGASRGLALRTPFGRFLHTLIRPIAWLLYRCDLRAIRKQATLPFGLSVPASHRVKT